MKKLIQISKEYESLMKEASEKEKHYFENHSALDFTIEIDKGNIPKWKKIEFDAEKKEIDFIKIAKQFGANNKLKAKELVVKISNEILNNPESINHYLLIRLMWEIGKEKKSFCIETLEKIIRRILNKNVIYSVEEYYLESFIDIWYCDTDKLIPIDILQTIILFDSEELEYSYGAMIKAVSYLRDYPKAEMEKVLSRARESNRYKTDDYYRQWIN